MRLQFFYVIMKESFQKTTPLLKNEHFNRVVFFYKIVLSMRVSIFIEETLKKRT